MLKKSGFDLWANNYDQSVNLSDEDNSYPFAGYKDILNKIYQDIHYHQDEGSILDIGFGTGILSKKLYDEGYHIYGIDFSPKMIEISKTKMPEAILLEHDFTEGIPEAFKNLKFDFIIMNYAIHHLSELEKLLFLNELLKMLNPKGAIYIGDVCFVTTEDFLRCKSEYEKIWDDDEIYIVYDELKKKLNCQHEFHQISHCSGILKLSKY